MKNNSKSKIAKIVWIWKT